MSEDKKVFTNVERPSYFNSISLRYPNSRILLPSDGTKIGNGNSGYIVVTKPDLSDLLAVPTNTQSLLADGTSSPMVPFAADASADQDFSKASTPGVFSVDCWLRPAGSGLRCFYSQSREISSGDYVQMRISNGNNIELIIRVSNNIAQYNTGIVLTLNEWVHVTLVYSEEVGNQFVRCYIDGVLEYEDTSLATQRVANIIGINGINIGSIVLGGSINKYAGYIDEMRVWHKALSVDDILRVKGKYTPSSMFPSLRGFFRFEESSGAVVNETSYADGSLVGASYSSVVPFTG